MELDSLAMLPALTWVGTDKLPVAGATSVVPGCRRGSTVDVDADVGEDRGILAEPPASV